MSTFIIILLIIIPFVLCGLSESPEGFLAGALLSFVIFISVCGITEKPNGYNLIPPKDYSVDTTPTNHYIYIKNENRIVVSTMVIDKVSEYNLVKTGEFEVKQTKYKNFFFDYDSKYIIVEKDETKQEKQ